MELDKLNNKIAQKIKELPITPGVYIYRNEKGKVIYVGKAVNLRNRVNSYFQSKDYDPKTRELVFNIASLEWLNVESEFEALILEADLIKRYKPKYNIRFRDDKNYVYIKITKEDYPRISVVHQVVDHMAEYIGPYTEAFAVKRALKLARYVYPYCTCRDAQKGTCLYFHLGLCLGKDKTKITPKDYQNNIKGIKKIFAGKTGALEVNIKKEMKAASANQEFERAARLRDKLFYLKKIKTSQLFSDRDLAADAGLSELARELSLPIIPKRIECYDISNVLGTSAVGSMVVVKNGLALPSHYRRFQIKTVKGANDFESLAEVVRRRFASIKRATKDVSFSELPDLIILDGGKGQLSTVTSRVQVPHGVRVVALAKRQEELVVLEKSDKGVSFKSIILPEGSEALYLVQRIRDEAHRFAVSYHRKLKGRQLFETSLDGIVGVGPKTKKKLISYFGSIEKIKEAKIEELSSQVGDILAKRIKESLC